jgi:hypothetical protein
MWRSDSALSHPSVVSAKAFAIDHADETITLLDDAMAKPTELGP